MSEKKKAVMFTDEQLEQVSGGKKQYEDLEPCTDGVPCAWNLSQCCQRTVYLNESGICTSFNPEDSQCTMICEWRPEVATADDDGSSDKNANPFIIM